MPRVVFTLDDKTLNYLQAISNADNRSMADTARSSIRALHQIVATLHDIRAKHPGKYQLEWRDAKGNSFPVSTDYIRDLGDQQLPPG